MGTFKSAFKICLSIIIALFWLLFSIKTLPMVFMTNDDTGIQMALSGMQTVKPYPYFQFINSFLGLFISVLYQITTNIPWWYAWSILCVLIGIVCIQWTVLENASNKLEAILFVGIFGFAFWIYILGNIAFTIVPCIFSLGIVFQLFSNDRPRWNQLFILICIIVVIISYWHRESTGLVMFCYFAMALLYFTVGCMELNLKQKILRYIGTLGITLILILGSTQVDVYIKAQRNSSEFSEYNNARALYMDYPHVSYDENPKIYESYGWNKNLSSLVSSWCFLDERVTAEAFLGISGAERIGIKDEVGADIDDKGFFFPLIELLETNNYALILSFISVFLLLFGEVYICVCGLFKSKLNFFFGSNVGGSIILLLYLIVNKRLPLRVYMVILIPMILISCLLLIKVHKVSKKKNSILWYSYVVILIALTIPAFLYNYDVGAINKKIERIENCNVIDNYLRANSQNIYISDYGAYDNNYPFSQVPQNLISWGGSAFYSEYFYLHLQENGLSELNMESFKQDNIYMLTASSSTNEYSKTIHKLFTCLVDYGAVGVQKVDVINGTRDVYKFHFDEFLEDYTGFYTIGKYTFYYVDGIRQTKDFVLDGVEYKCGDKKLVWNGVYWINTVGYIKKVKE